MPYQVKQIIEAKSAPICVTKDDSVAKALSLMIEYDYSQLPVIVTKERFELPDGMITYESILRGIRNFKASVDDLKVRDVIVAAPMYDKEEDLFYILDRLKDTNAVLITDTLAPFLAGIVTSYDATQYFRDRTEDLMRVEEIESMIKEFIQITYTEPEGGLIEAKLNAAIARVTPNAAKGNGESGKTLAFDDLTLSDYNNLLLMPDTWPLLEPILGVRRDFARPLLTGIRDTRNDLAHFRAGDITPEQRDQLKFGAQWLTHRKQEYEEKLDQERNRQLQELFAKQNAIPALVSVREEPGQYDIGSASPSPSADYSVTEADTSGGRWAALADWLQSLPGGVDSSPMTFTQIEEITKSPLPESARNYRAWWANEAVGHSQSQQWLAAGWRTTYINLTEGRVTFSRIRERERAYIAFFSKLLDDLRKTAKMPVREVSPDGVSWIVIQTLPRRGGQNGVFGFSFTRDNRMRVELYLDLGDQSQTKAAFDNLLAQKDQIEAPAGSIEWERLNTRRASRLAQYHEGQITDEKNHAALRKWAVETMIKFYGALAEPAEKAILEAKQA